MEPFVIREFKVKMLNYETTKVLTMVDDVLVHFCLLSKSRAFVTRDLKVFNVGLRSYEGLLHPIKTGIPGASFVSI